MWLTCWFQYACAQVRSAGEEAWLCREAPEDPVFDAPADEHLLRPLAMSAAEARIYSP